jgi:hypothetical protein
MVTQGISGFFILNSPIANMPVIEMEKNVCQEKYGLFDYPLNLCEECEGLSKI